MASHCGTARSSLLMISCHGHAAAALRVLDDQASKEQCRYKSDKCKVVARNFAQRWPIPLQDGHVQYVQTAPL